MKILYRSFPKLSPGVRPVPDASKRAIQKEIENNNDLDNIMRPKDGFHALL